MLDRSYLTQNLPTLIVWGGRDGIIPVEHAEVAHGALPGSRLEIFERAGHFPHHDDPERFVKVVEEFLGTTEAAVYDRSVWREILRAGRPGPGAAEPSSGS
jgi:pimeloyl-ACP methyl ester carboxylesterase